MNAPLPIIRSGFGLEGWMRFRVYKADTNRLVRDTGYFRNLITDQGLDAIAQQADVMTWFHVGTSSAAPAVTDTWVGSHVASSNTIRETVAGVSGATPHYGYKRRTIRFDVGTATGNLSEAAVGWSATTGTAFSHELIRDGAGAPTTITVLSDEYLDFTYELRYIVPTTDATGTINISAVAYDYTVRALAATSTFWWADFIGNLFTFQNTLASYHEAYTGVLGTITASDPTGTDSTGTTSLTVSTYSVGTYFRNFTVSASPTEWNVAGGVIRSLVLGCKGNRWQAEFAKVSDGTGISKSPSNTLLMNWRVSWTRTP